MRLPRTSHCVTSVQTAMVGNQSLRPSTSTLRFDQFDLELKALWKRLNATATRIARTNPTKPADWFPVVELGLTFFFYWSRHLLAPSDTL